MFAVSRRRVFNHRQAMLHADDVAQPPQGAA
jgi:hypothetical protein